MATLLAPPAAPSKQDGLQLQVANRNGTRLLIVSPEQPGRLKDHAAALPELVTTHLHDTGALLFRGFSWEDVAGFREFVAGFGRELLTYEFGSTPRSAMGGGVYSSTEYPAHQWIPQHNEQSYTRRWPGLLWFWCDQPSASGGETPIADSRIVHGLIDPAIRERFARHGLLYVRNYGNGLDVSWAQVFQTDDRDEVERYCRANGVEWEWLDDDGLRTRQVCQSELRHPVTGEVVWFNQAHLFHVSALAREVRESLFEVFDEDELPRNVYYGDGSPIEDSVLDEIRGHYEQSLLALPWQHNDVLMLDNMLVSHGRAPFQGPRRVLVAMAS